MTYVTLSPNGTAANSGAVTGTSAHAALSDSSDATYVDYDFNEGSILTLSDLSLPSGAVIVSAQVFTQSAKQATGPAAMNTFLAADETKQALTSVTWDTSSVQGGAFAWGGLTDSGLDGASLGINSSGLSALRVYKAWVRVMYLTKPTVTVTNPTGTITSSTTGVVWTPSFDTHAEWGQHYREVKIFSQAQYSASGFDPTSSTATADSGVQLAGAWAHNFSNLALPDGSYRAYVRIAASNSPDHWSDWDYEAFTVDVDRPGNPSLTLNSGDGHIEIVLDDSTGDVTTSSFQVQRHVSDESYVKYVASLDCSLLLPLGTTDGLTDASGNGHNGTAAGGVTIGEATGPLTVGAEGATNFDGSNDRVTTSYSPFVNGSTLTVMGWAYRDTSGSDDALFGGTASSNAPKVMVASGTNHVVFYSDFGGGSYVVWSNAWPGNGVWAHWAIMFNESTNVAELFINGVSQGTQSQTTPYSASPGSFQVGAFASVSNPFDGKIALVSVHSRALSATEIEAAYLGSGLFWDNVRTGLGHGFVSFPGQPVTQDDHEAPNGSTVTYRARAYNASVPSYSEWVYGTGFWSSDRWWLKHPFRPSLSRVIALRSYSGWEEQANQGVFRPLGSSVPVVVQDARGPVTGEITVLTESAQERNDLYATLAEVSPLLLQGPVSAEIPERWVAVDAAASSRIVDGANFPKHDERLAWTEVGRPEGPLEE